MQNLQRENEFCDKNSFYFKIGVIKYKSNLGF